MNTPIILAAIGAACIVAWLIAAHFAPLGFEDATGFHTGTPSPCERDAQDGRGEAGEGGEFRTIHNQGDTHVG